jgi:hypothetical protein
MARFMAGAAVKNTIENKGLEPAGEFRHACKSAMVGTECTARQLRCTKIRRIKISVAAWNE